VTFLIDGYNLLHAVGWASPRMPGKSLEAARRRLLDWLADLPGEKRAGARFRVVFDAQKGPADSPERTHRGVWYLFAYRRTADDLIEELLAAAATPKRLTVVSNDTRLHESARRSGARGWGCQAFLDWLLAEPSARAADEAPEKPDGPPSPEEAAELLRVFDIPQPRRTRKLR
jgi:predicted RNA-binding protein with PIN domain